MEELFRKFAEPVAFVAEAFSVLIIAVGLIQAAFGLLKYWTGSEHTHGARKQIWLRFGVWLLLGLEFELAADIVKSVISPTWNDILQLAAIAAVRTFLNYFLEKDVEKYGEQPKVPWAEPGARAA